MSSVDVGRYDSRFEIYHYRNNNTHNGLQTEVDYRNLWKNIFIKALTALVRDLFYSSI